MEDLLGCIFEVLLQPFEPLYDSAFEWIKEIPYKWVRILLSIVLIAIPLSLFLIVYLVCIRVFEGD